MNDSTTPPTIDSLRPVGALLPMIYVAWSDGALDAEEIAAVRSAALGAAKQAPDQSRILLERWLDPERPPNAVELALLLDGVEEAARRANLDADARVDLAGLGLAIAAASEGVAPVEREGLLEVQRALGIDGSEAARQLLASGRPGAPRVTHEPSFPAAVLSDRLDEPRSELRARVRELLNQPDMAPIDEPTRAAYRTRVFEWLETLADAGLGGLAFPEDAGGAGDTEGFAVAFETLAEGDLSLLIKFGVQFGLFGGSVNNLGDAEQQKEFLPQIASLDLPGCFAMTETSHGSNVADLETTATFDADAQEFVVHSPSPGATKNYIGNAAVHGQMATVFAQLITGPGGEGEGGRQEHGVHALLVPIRDEDGQTLPGVTIEDDGLKIGLNGVDNGRIAFDHVRVPRRHLLARFAQVAEDGSYSSAIASPSARFFTMLGTLVGGRVSVAAASNTVAKKALWIAVRYGNRRRQFGPPGEPEFALLDYLSHQERLLPRLARTYALHFALRDLTGRYAAVQDGPREGEDPKLHEQMARELETRAAGLKAVATWHGSDTIQECREACGGQGYLAENQFGEMRADADIFTTFEGDNTVLLQLVAKGLLSSYRKQFGDMTLRRAVRYAASRVRDELTERLPSWSKLDDETARSREFQAKLLAARERQLLGGLARRLKRRLDDGMDSSRAVLEVQDHMIELARAHVDVQVFESFVSAIDASDPEVQPVLERLRSLFVLDLVEQDRGWFLEHGVLGTVASQSLRGVVNGLLTELRPDAEALVSCWRFPDQWADAPIAQ